MPLQDIKLRPGVDREGTATSAEGTWYESNNVRFRRGAPEKIGGWKADGSVVDPSQAPVPFGSFWGVARHLFNWLTLARENMLGIGTHMKYYIQRGVGGVIYDVTPISSTTIAGAVTFAATNGSAVLVVNNPGHGAYPGDFVRYIDAVSLGGNVTDVVLNREYQITEVIDSNSYRVLVAVTANALDVGNGGAVVVAKYQLSIGREFAEPGTGWGAGGWGGVTGGDLTGWGSPAGLSIAINLQPRLWSASNFGERLLANPRNGGIYLWTPNV